MTPIIRLGPECHYALATLFASRDGSGGIPEQVSDGIEALLVPPGNDRALADACRRILADRAFGARLAAAAADRLGQADPEAAVNAVAALYSHVLREQPVPAETL